MLLSRLQIWPCVAALFLVAFTVAETTLTTTIAPAANTDKIAQLIKSETDRIVQLVKSEISSRAPDALHHPLVVKFFEKTAPVYHYAYKLAASWAFAVYVQPWEKTYKVVKTAVLLPWQREKFSFATITHHIMLWVFKTLPFVLGFVIVAAGLLFALKQYIQSNSLSYEDVNGVKIGAQNDQRVTSRLNPGVDSQVQNDPASPASQAKIAANPGAVRNTGAQQFQVETPRKTRKAY